MKRITFIKRGLYAALGYVLGAPLLGGSKIEAAGIPTFKPEPWSWADDRLTLTWVGHSTILMNFQGVWILTDPVFFARVGLYMLGYTWGPSRYTLPALYVSEIPKPEIVLLSHSHMDHTDLESLKAITKRFPGQIDVISSHLSKDVIEDLSWKSIKELDWGEEYSVAGVGFKALEVRHFGWRYPWEKDRSRGFIKDGRSYNAYLIKRNGKKVLFGGDTANTDKLEVIKNEKVDVAIMPVGAYNPWKFAHCNPEEALTMAGSIGAEYFIPIHCNTFQQGREPKEEPISWVSNSITKYNMKLGLDAIGKTFSL